MMTKSGKAAHASDSEEMYDKPQVRGKTNDKWTAIGSIVSGAIHIRQKMPCQDAIHVHTAPDYVVACVADGHGSSSCPHSDEGAKAAVEVAGQLLTSMLERGLDTTTLSAQKDIWLPKQIETQWNETIRNLHAKNERETTEPFPYILYGTTLLALAATETFIFVLQIGDGDILMMDSSGVARPLLPTEEKVGEDTESLCLVDAWKYVRTQIIPWNATDGAPMFLLSTDGYANSFADSAGFYKAGVDFLQLWQEEGLDYLSENLEGWLRISSDKGSGDDISLVLVGRS